MWLPQAPAIRNTPIGQGESTRLFPTVEAHDHSVIVKIYRIYESINHYSLVVIACQVKGLHLFEPVNDLSPAELAAVDFLIDDVCF